MRCESAASAKGYRASYRQNMPAEGTKVRLVYDLLLANKGKPVAVPFEFTRHKSNNGRVRAVLEDFYGLDIRTIKVTPFVDDGGNTRCTKWVLVGEWFGKDYADYIAGKLDESVDSPR